MQSTGLLTTSGKYMLDTESPVTNCTRLKRVRGRVAKCVQTSSARAGSVHSALAMKSAPMQANIYKIMNISVNADIMVGAHSRKLFVNFHKALNDVTRRTARTKRNSLIILSISICSTPCTTGWCPMNGPSVHCDITPPRMITKSNRCQPWVTIAGP